MKRNGNQWESMKINEINGNQGNEYNQWESVKINKTKKQNSMNQWKSIKSNANQ